MRQKTKKLWQPPALAEAKLFLEATPDNVMHAESFVLRKWVERWHERNPDGPSFNAAQGWNKPPVDLSGSCKFSSLFARAVFGGEIRGNYDHQYVILHDGAVLDLNRNAADVKGLPDPYRHDATFFGSRSHRESVGFCLDRARDWVEAFRLEVDATETPVTSGPKAS